MSTSAHIPEHSITQPKLQPHLLGKRGYSSSVLVNNPPPSTATPEAASERVTRATVASMIQTSMKSITDAESRAKNYSDEWHNVALWQMDDSASPYTIYFNQWSPLSFPLEIIRGQHCVNRGPFALPYDGWAFRPPIEKQGVYLVSSYLTIQHSNAAAVYSTKLGITVGGVFRAELDQMDDDDSGDGVGTQRDVWLGNSMPVNLDGTKELQLCVYVRSTNTNDTYSNTGSVSIGGWVAVTRVGCYEKGTESDGKINNMVSKYITPV